MRTAEGAVAVPFDLLGQILTQSAAQAHPTFMKTAQAQRKSIPVFEVKWKGAHKLFYIVPPAADSEPLSPTSAVTDSASLEQTLSFLDSRNLSCTEPREPEPLLSQPTSSLFDVAVKNELLDSWNRSQTGTGKQRSIKPNSSAKNNLLDSWNSNAAASISAAGLLDSWGQDQVIILVSQPWHF
eukprot:g51936.t1